jgi:hypothetical protein
MSADSAGRGLLKLVYVLRHVVALTAPPLLVLTISMILSGYALMAPQILSKFFGIGYGEGVVVHSAPLIRFGFAALALLHGWAGTLVLILPRLIRAGRVMLAYVTLAALSLALLYLLTPLLLVELSR